MFQIVVEGFAFKAHHQALADKLGCGGLAAVPFQS
jgi:hypothetical protein